MSKHAPYPVSIQYTGAMPMILNREQRKSFLSEQFNAVSAVLERNEVVLDPDSLSVSGQNMSATVPHDKLQSLTDELKSLDFAVANNGPFKCACSCGPGGCH